MEQTVKAREEAGSTKTQETVPPGDGKSGVGDKTAPAETPKEIEKPPAATEPLRAFEITKTPQESSRIIWQILSVCSILSPIGFFAYCWWSYSKESPGLNIRALDEFAKTALQINLDTTHSLANLTVGLLGGVWAILLGSKKKRKIIGWELVPLIGGSISLVLSYISYRMGLIKYVEMLFEAETVDITAGFVKDWPTWQFFFFIYGFVVLVIALLTIYRRS